MNLKKLRIVVDEREKKSGIPDILKGIGINLEIKTTDAEVESKFVEAAAFAYLAYMERGEIFSPR